MKWKPSKAQSDFVASYPTWAKLILLANLACFIGVLIFARGADNGDGGGENGHALTIEKVTLFPTNKGDVHVTAIIDGINYDYPSIGDVKWMSVGPKMAGQLPSASGAYVIRFEMNHIDHLSGKVMKSTSPEILELTKPKSGIYKLYPFNPENATPGAGAEAEVQYSFK